MTVDIEEACDRDDWEPTGLGKTIFKDRYARDPEESWTEASLRLAQHVAQAEENGKVRVYEQRFFNQIVSGKFCPGGRIWYGSGRPKAQLLNCFVVPAADSREGWGKATSDVIVISGLMGGVGLNVSPIRPRGSAIHGTGGYATGAVSLMELINGVGDVIVGGGGRRMALMLCLDINHPDVEEFLHAKLDLNKLNNANISVVIPPDFDTDLFVQKVLADDDIELVFNGVQSGKTIKAKDVWETVVENSWRSGEPGVLNGYLANKMNNIHYMAPLISTNPCFAASERLLTETGYSTFGYLYGKGYENVVLSDNRVSYLDDGGPESPEKWVITPSSDWNATPYAASPVILTRTSAELVKIQTNMGYSVRCTPDHKIATPNGMIEAQALRQGDTLLLTLPQPTGSIVNTSPVSVDEKVAFLCGLIAGDGTFGRTGRSGTMEVFIDLWGPDAERMARICEDIIQDLYEDDYASGVPSMTPHNAWGTRRLTAVMRQVRNSKIRLHSSWLANFLSRYSFTKETKHIVPEFVMQQARTDVGRFYLASLFYADGTVNTSPNSLGIRLAQSDRPMLVDVQLLLQANGIASSLYLRREAQERKLPDGRGGLTNYACKAQYELVISSGRILYSQTIGFAGHPNKEEKSRTLPVATKVQRSPQVVSVESDGIEDVFCLQQKETRSVVVNGLAVTRCGEIWLERYGCCCLGALVLPRFVKGGKFDWDAFDESVRLGVRYLDNVLTVNHYPLPEIKENCENVRRIGLGVMGLHTMLLELGLTYDSTESFEFVDKLFNVLKNTAYDASINLAIEKGPFPAFDLQFLDSGFAKTLKRGIRNKVREHGIRNCAILTIAPTGTTSMMEAVSSGIEPLPPAVYWRNYYKPNKNGERDLKRELVVEEAYYKYPDRIQSALDIPVENHFKMQAIIQKHIDNAVSKTINMAKEYPKDKFGDVWLKYLPQLKGTTVYRYGSRENEPINPAPREDWDAIIASHKAVDSELTVEEFMTLDCPDGACDISSKLSI